jgi:hypothetical protein
MSAIVEKFREVVVRTLPKAPEPPFAFQIGWAKSYDDLFNGQFTISGEKSVLDNTLSRGRVLISGRGGSAKTILLNRMVQLAAERESLPLKINLQSWTSKEIEAWAQLAPDVSSRLGQLIKSAKIEGLDLAVYASLSPNLSKLLIVDGLNELPSTIGQQVIDTLDAAVTGQPGTKVLVSDRLVRRDLRAPHRWSLSSILPLSPAEVTRHLKGNDHLLSEYRKANDDQRSLWRSPFFFDNFLRFGDKGFNPSSTFSSFMSRVQLSENDLEQVSTAAFLLYRGSSSRTFQTDVFEQLTSHTIVKRLRDAGVLKSDGAARSYFQHHLEHDYFAARFLSANPQHWNQQGFDIISFGASSFDSLSMTLEQIRAIGEAEKFLKALFDWNPYAAAYCIAEQKSHSQVPHEMKLVVFAMMAERRFDLFDATRQRANDALLLLSDSAAKPFIEANDISDVIKAVSSLHGSAPWFSDWQQTFSSSRQDRLRDDIVRKMQSEDSIIGWTISNVLKRAATSPEQLGYIARLTLSRRSVVRWRAVHTLGGFPSYPTLATLRAVLKNDKDRWVLFGTVRSIVEIAALGTSRLRVTAFRALLSDLDKICAENRTKNELSSVLLISKMERPAEWRELVAEILMRLYERDTAPGAYERMEAVTRRFNAIYRRSE